MELKFTNKPTINQIIEKATSYGKLEYNLNNESVLMYGENFIGLSKLLNTYKNFIDLIYIDPPFNTNQSFFISSKRANTISYSKSGNVAYDDLMNNEEFLLFMYERFVLLHELLSDQGSLYVHIDTRMGSYFKVLLDEVFGLQNFKNAITRIKSNPKNFDRKAYGNEKDVILFYSKKADCNIWNEIKIKMSAKELESKYRKVDSNGRHYTTIPLHAPGETAGVTGQMWRGMVPPEGRHWRTSPDEFDRLDSLGLIEWSKTGNPRIIKYADEHKGKKIQDIWTFKDPQSPLYPTQKNLEMLELIVKQSSNERSYVLDCFAGSGTTLLAAQKLNRRFIGIDQSKDAIEIIKNRLAISSDNCINL